MNRIATYLIICILITSDLFVNAQQIAITSKLDTNIILIGDQVKLKFTFNAPINCKVNFPLFNEPQLTDKIDIVSQSGIDTVYSKNKLMVSLSKEIIITSFDSGKYVLPSLEFQYFQANDTIIYSLFSDSINLFVNTIAVDTNIAIKDIKAPLDIPFSIKELLPYIIGGIILIALIILSIIIIRRFKRKKNNEILPAKPKIQPFKKALQDFETLRQKKLWQNDKIKEYHSELTDILRTYFENQLQIQAMEKTSDETLEAFESVIKDSDLSKKLHSILTLADLVKFAKQLPLPDQHDLSLQYAIEIVKQTSVNITKTENTENLNDIKNV